MDLTYLIIQLISIVTLGFLWCQLLEYLDFKYNNHNLIKKVNVLPGPFGLPIIGSAYIFIFKKLTEILDIVNQMAQTYVSPMRGWILQDAYILIYDADQVQIILTRIQKNIAEASEVASSYYLLKVDKEKEDEFYKSIFVSNDHYEPVP